MRPANTRPPRPTRRRLRSAASSRATARERRVYIVAYDVATATPAGRRRWRAVSRRCELVGERVQWSVFRCALTRRELDVLRAELLALLDVRVDRLTICRVSRAPAAAEEWHGPATGSLVAPGASGLVVA